MSRFDNGCRPASAAARARVRRMIASAVVELPARHASIARSTRDLRVLGEQLQDPDELPRPGRRAVLPSSAARKPAKRAGSFQSRNTGAWSSAAGLAAQRRQVVERVEDLLRAAVAPRVRRRRPGRRPPSTTRST